MSTPHARDWSKVDAELMEWLLRHNGKCGFLWISGEGIEISGHYAVAATPDLEGTRRLVRMPEMLREIANKIEKQLKAKEVYGYPPRKP